MGYHLGLSSSTGQLADNHDIIMLKTYEVDLVEGQTFDAVVSGIWCCCVISVDNKHVNQSLSFPMLITAAKVSLSWILTQVDHH